MIICIIDESCGRWMFSEFTKSWLALSEISNRSEVTDIQCTIKEDQEDPKIFTCEEHEPVNSVMVCPKTTETIDFLPKLSVLNQLISFRSAS